MPTSTVLSKIYIFTVVQHTEVWTNIKVSNNVGALEQVFIVSHSCQTCFSFPGFVINLAMGCVTM